MSIVNAKMASTLEENWIQTRKLTEMEGRLQESQVTIDQRNSQLYELRRKLEENLIIIQRSE